MTLRVAGFRSTARFDADVRKAPLDVRSALAHALKTLKTNPSSRLLRLHPLAGFGKPAVWKIDVFANHSWQVTFEMETGDIAKLCRLAPHKRIDRDPRAE